MFSTSFGGRIKDLSVFERIIEVFQFCGEIFSWEKNDLNIFEYRFKQVTGKSSMPDEMILCHCSADGRERWTHSSALVGILFMLSGDAVSEQSHDSRTCLASQSHSRMIPCPTQQHATKLGSRFGSGGFSRWVWGVGGSPLQGIFL